MFVRLLVMLISHVLCCFGVLVCCRSLVQFVVQMSEIEQKMESWPLPVRSSALCLSPRGTIECMPSQPRITRCPSLHCFNTCTVGIYWQLRAIERSAIERTAHASLRSNALHTVERIWDCDQLHHLRSSAPLT